MAHVVMYSRARCGLCDEAREAIRSVEGQADPGFTFEEIPIDGDDRLERDYGLRVPVVLIDGREEFELVVDSTVLASLVASGAKD